MKRKEIEREREKNAAQHFGGRFNQNADTLLNDTSTHTQTHTIDACLTIECTKNNFSFLYSTHCIHHPGQ